MTEEKAVPLTSQKVVVGILGLLAMGGCYALFNHDFALTSKAENFSHYVSLLFASCSVITLGILGIKKLWKPATPWSTLSTPKKIFIVSAGFSTLWYLFWLNLAVAIPRFFTSVYGIDSVKADLVVKDKNRSRKAYDYRLEPLSIDATHFHFCISSNVYDQLPDSEIPAELVIRQSALGYIVKDIRLLHQKKKR